MLVETPITTAQTGDLIDWIELIAPGRKLSYIAELFRRGPEPLGVRS